MWILKYQFPLRINRTEVGILLSYLHWVTLKYLNGHLKNLSVFFKFPQDKIAKLNQELVDY